MDERRYLYKKDPHKALIGEFLNQRWKEKDTGKSITQPKKATFVKDTNTSI